MDPYSFPAHLYSDDPLVLERAALYGRALAAQAGVSYLEDQEHAQGAGPAFQARLGPALARFCREPLQGIYFHVPSKALVLVGDHRTGVPLKSLRFSRPVRTSALGSLVDSVRRAQVAY